KLQVPLLGLLLHQDREVESILQRDGFEVDTAGRHGPSASARGDGFTAIALSIATAITLTVAWREELENPLARQPTLRLLQAQNLTFVGRRRRRVPIQDSRVARA